MEARDKALEELNNKVEKNSYKKQIDTYNKLEDYIQKMPEKNPKTK